MTCILVLTLSYYINYVTSSVQVPHLPKFPDVPSFSKEGRGGSSSHDQDSYWNNIWNNKKVTTGDPPFYENVMKTTLFLSQNSSLHHPSFCWFSLCDLWIKICFTTHQLQPHPHDNPMITPLFQSPKKKTKASQVKFRSPVSSTSTGDAASMLLDHQWKSSWNGEVFYLPLRSYRQFWIQSSLFGEPSFFSKYFTNHPQMSNPHLEVVHQRLLRRCHHRRSAMKKSRRLGGVLGKTHFCHRL